MKINLLSFFAISMLVLVACSPKLNFKKDKNAFDLSKSITTYKAVGDLNDSYFSVKENNYFEFYMQLFDSVKNTVYPGKYTKNGDTLLLKFYNKNAEAFLGSKALINNNKKEIVFFDNQLGVKRKLIFN